MDQYRYHLLIRLTRVLREVLVLDDDLDVTERALLIDDLDMDSVTSFEIELALTEKFDVEIDGGDLILRQRTRAGVIVLTVGDLIDAIQADWQWQDNDRAAADPSYAAARAAVRAVNAATV